MASETSGRARRVAVFGGSEVRAGEPVYEAARDLGRRLAQAGYEVVTGGYSGVMEAASRGAKEAGGAAHGVTCEIFSVRSPNEYLTVSTPTVDLHARTQVLIELSGAFVVLPGKTGTLAELSFLWALQRAGSLRDTPVLLLGDLWAPLLAHLSRWGMIEKEQLETTRVVASVEEAVAALGPAPAGIPAEE